MSSKKVLCVLLGDVIGDGYEGNENRLIDINFDVK